MQRKIIKKKKKKFNLVLFLNYKIIFITGTFLQSEINFTEFHCCLS